MGPSPYDLVRVRANCASPLDLQAHDEVAVQAEPVSLLPENMGIWNGDNLCATGRGFTYSIGEGRMKEEQS